MEKISAIIIAALIAVKGSAQTSDVFSYQPQELTYHYNKINFSFDPSQGLNYKKINYNNLTLLMNKNQKPEFAFEDKNFNYLYDENSHNHYFQFKNKNIIFKTSIENNQPINELTISNKNGSFFIVNNHSLKLNNFNMSKIHINNLTFDKKISFDAYWQNKDFFIEYNKTSLSQTDFKDLHGIEDSYKYKQYNFTNSYYISSEQININYKYFQLTLMELPFKQISLRYKIN